MASKRNSWLSPSWLCTFLMAFAFVAPSQGLYFYMDAHSPKCFFEELPKDTLVVGHYTAEQWDNNARTYIPAPNMQIQITVDEIFDNDHRVVNNRGPASGKFTFTAADSGDHKMCFTPIGATVGGWMAGQPAQGGVKFQLDLAIGETSDIETEDKGKMEDIVQKVKDLNGRLEGIRREQIFQREREAEFRDQSELTNSRVVKWTMVQLVVLGVTCAWQLSHLRAFFIKQKLT